VADPVRRSDFWAIRQRTEISFQPSAFSRQLSAHKFQLLGAARRPFRSSVIAREIAEFAVDFCETESRTIKKRKL
jgi:hypothetical protein